MALEDDDPFWEQHDGGSGHRDHPEWTVADVARAGTFYAATHGQAKSVLDLLIDRPGDLLDADWIAGHISASDSGSLARRNQVAASIGGMSAAAETAERRYPFYWWRGQDGAPTRYAMKPSIAALFRRVRRESKVQVPDPGQPANGRADGRLAERLTYWWDDVPGENVFMEITRRDDIGTDLKAPSAAESVNLDEALSRVSY